MTSFPLCEVCQKPVIERASNDMRSLGYICLCQTLPHRPTPPTLAERVEYAFEADLVEACRKEAEKRGWLFIRIGQRKAKGSGTDLGAPDFLLRVPSWPRGLWLAFETKVGGNTFSDAQAVYVAQGAILSCRSVAQMVEAAEGVGI